jgi:hypothetical protein
MNPILPFALQAGHPARLGWLFAEAVGEVGGESAGAGRGNLMICWFFVSVLVMLGVLTTWLACVGLKRWRVGPSGLFSSLCRVHKLKWSDRWLLWHLAGYYRMADPSRVFVEPERFDPQGLPPHLAGRAARLSELRENLFYEAPPPKDKASAFTASAATEPMPVYSPPMSTNTPLFVVESHPTLETDHPLSGGEAVPLGGA